jgi:hypothetical protein
LLQGRSRCTFSARHNRRFWIEELHVQQQHVQQLHFHHFAGYFGNSSNSWPGQTNCEDGNGLLDFAQPKTMTVPEIIQKIYSG